MGSLQEVRTRSTTGTVYHVATAHAKRHAPFASYSVIRCMGQRRTRTPGSSPAGRGEQAPFPPRLAAKSRLCRRLDALGQGDILLGDAAFIMRREGQRDAVVVDRDVRMVRQFLGHQRYAVDEADAFR